MFIKNTDLLLDNINLTGDTLKEFESHFRAIAGSRLSSCKDINGMLSKYNIFVNGENEELTREIYLNSIILLYCKEEDEVFLSDDRALILSKKYGKSSNKLSVDELSDWFIGLVGLNSSSSKKDGKSDKLSNSDSDKIKQYYYQFYKGVVSELSKRYSSLFESGYEVVKPAGLLSSSGMIGLSGNKLAVKKYNISVVNMYNIFTERLDFLEVPYRSNVKIADTIYDSYFNKEKKLLYFPNKLIEYAYGRKAPSGDNQDSVNTYENHSSSSNWGTYCKSEVLKSLMSVVSSSVVKFIYLSSKDGNYYSEELAEKLQDYLVYLQRCLSLCILMVEYKSKARGIDEDVYAFKVRVCDPCNSLGTYDLTKDIINRAFMGSTGDVPFSYKPRIEDETFVKEYAHEFNHDSSQASPLFAYKAYQALQNQGVNPTWNNMILGMFEDGTILKNGKNGVSLEKRLTHQIAAGSRAGKGVMTLNVLASGIYSNKNVFYLDRKPDMASLFKKLSPNMFVMNGGGYSNQYDFYQQFTNVDSIINWNNIPNYITEMLGVSKSYNELGDLFYMRALKLALGIIIARGDGQINNPNFGGENGILLVVDEFKNFQESFSSIIERMTSNVPPCNYETIVEKKNNGKITDKEYNNSFNNGTLYALSYLNSLVADLEFLSTKRDAGFNQKEVELSDIFVIGQSLDYGALDFRGFRTSISDSTNSDRYRNAGSSGLKTSTLRVGDSFPYTMLNFKTCDAFLGRNMEDGRDVYLAQGNPQSKAYGRLDDKASNFAYLNTFSDETRRKIIGGVVRDNIELSNKCVYFKPFLVLNTSGVGDKCVEDMFDRCAGAGNEAGREWVSREEIISENPNSDGSYINEAVGFEGYLEMMGISDYSERLSRSGDIANYVVQNCLGYNGTWFDFITDLRPEWCFTIKDIADGAKGIRPAILNVETNPVISEFVRFNPSLFGLGGMGDNEEDISTSDLSISEFMSSDEEYNDSSEEVDFDDIFEDTKDVEVNLFDDEDEIDFYTPVVEDAEEVLKVTGSKEAEINELLNRLNELGYDIPEVTESEKMYNSDEEYGQRSYVSENDGYKDFESTDESVYNETIDNLEDLVSIVTKDVLKKFGGLNNIVSLKVLGGSIVVNGYYYKCKLGNLNNNNIPYDVRREVNSGNIGRLFNFSTLRNMSRLRDLEFDSTSFVYDYVSYALGYGSHISVDLFFKDLKALQRLCIGRKLFKRETHMEQIKNDDVFYKPRLATKYANYSEEILGRVGQSSWSFTKNTMKSSDYGIIMKTLGVTGGLVATGVSVGGKLGIKGGRKLLGGLKSITKSFKDIIEESKKY